LVQRAGREGGGKKEGRVEAGNKPHLADLLLKLELLQLPEMLLLLLLLLPQLRRLGEGLLHVSSQSLHHAPTKGTSARRKL
jgi:hypothetical protein